MNKLLDFLTENPIEGIKEKKRISKRIPFEFEYKAMSSDEHKEYQNKCKGKVKKDGVEFDATKFNLLVVVGNTLEPNFSDAQAIKSMGVATPTELVKKTLLSGEINELAENIIRLSGFEADINDAIEEAKN